LAEDNLYQETIGKQHLGCNPQDKYIINLEQFFGVSRKAMCWRLEDLKLITREQSEKYCINVIQSARSLGKNTDLYLPTNDKVMISDYVEKASEALQKNLITDSRYEEILADADLLERVMEVPEEADFVD